MSSGYEQFFKKAKQANRNNYQDISSMNSEAHQIKNKNLKFAKGKKQKKSFPIIPFLSFAVLGTFSFFVVEHFEDFETQFKKIEISMGIADAKENDLSDQGKKADANAKKKNGEETKSTENESKEIKAASIEKSPSTVNKNEDDADYLFKLAERKKTLDQREEDLNKLAAELEKQKIEIEEKIIKLEETRSKISSVLQEKIKADDVRIDSLVQMYTSMKPQQVAKVFETLDEDLVIDILSRMKKKTAADILNLIKPEKAQIFAEKYTGYRAPASP